RIESEIMKLLSTLVVLALSLLGMARGAAADDFYKGKTITMMVGFSPGGGFDINARLLARYLGRYIPGNPDVLVLNLPRDGSVVAVQRLDTVSPTDGTVIDTFNFGLMGDSVLQPDKIKVDFRNYAFIGSISQDLTVCYTWAALGFKSIDAMKKRDHFFW